MKNFSWLTLLFLLYSSSHIAAAQENYITVEERNRRAQQDVMRLMKEMQEVAAAKKDGTYVPKETDYSQYTNIIDFKNVFGNLAADPEPASFIEQGRIWQQNNQQRHFDYLKNIEFDIIVVPIQDFSKKYDLTSLLFPAELLAEKITSITGKKVLPPGLFIHSIDSLRPVMQEYQITQSENRENITYVCLYLKIAQDWEFIGEGTLFHKLAVVVTDSGGKIDKFKIFAIGEASDEQTIEVMIQNNIDEIATFITGKQPQTPPALLSSNSNNIDWAVEGTLEELLKKLHTPLDHAAYLQLIGLLTPQDFDSERKHLFQRSLIALDKETSSTPDHKLLEARALHYLHRRPQAMKILKECTTPELRALKAYLNGNYPALKDNSATIKSPLLATLAFLELDELSLEYGKTPPSFPENFIGESWLQLLLRAAGVRQHWYTQDDQEIAIAMKTILPVLHEMEQEVRKEMLPYIDQQVNDMSTLSKELLMHTLSEAALDPAVLPYTDKLVRTDIYNLFRNIIADSVVRSLRKKVYLQALYERGVNFAWKRSALFEGHPGYSYYYALGLYNMALQHSRHQRHYFLREAAKKTCDVMDTTPAHNLYHELSKELRKSLIHKGFNENSQRCSNLQYRSFYPSNKKDYNYLVTDIASLTTAHSKKKIDENTFKEIMSNRFDGHPDKIQWKATSLKKTEGNKQAISYLQDQIKNDIQVWGIYRMLGDYLIEDGSIQAASKAYFSFPDLITLPSKRRVATANIAHEIGERFYRTAHSQKAIPFYTLSNSIGTGAGSEMKSRFRLACLKGDFNTAAEEAYKHWQRYESKSAFGNYALILQLMGYDEKIDEDISALLVEKGTQGQYYNTNLWTAYLTDKTIKAEDTAISLKNLQALSQANTSLSLKKNIHKAAFKSAFIDRKLSSANLKLLEKIAPETSFRPRIESQLSRLILGLSTDVSKEEKTTQKLQSKAIRAHSRRYTDLYKGCMFLQHKDVQQALTAFLDYERYSFASNRSLTGKIQGDLVFPYALKTFVESDHFSKDKLDLILQARENNKDREFSNFTDHLVNAIAFSVKGETEAAFHSLKKAPLSFITYESELEWYQLVHLTEWLYEYTANTDFLSLALLWVNKLQILYPYLSWPHAFEALYESEDDKRIEAAAYAWYLDRNSYWLSRTPESIRQAGKTAWPKIQQKMRAEHGQATLNETNI